MSYPEKKHPVTKKAPKHSLTALRLSSRSMSRTHVKPNMFMQAISETSNAIEEALKKLRTVLTDNPEIKEKKHIIKKIPKPTPSQPPTTDSSVGGGSF